MDTPPPKKFSQQRYWRFVFTPFLLFLIGFGIYILFTMPDTHLISTNDLKTQIGVLKGTGSGNNGNAFSNVGSPGSVRSSGTAS